MNQPTTDHSTYNLPHDPYWHLADNVRRAVDARAATETGQ